MTAFAFTVDCHCGCGTIVAVTNSNLAVWQNTIAAGDIGNIGCGTCGCEHVLQDGGSQLNTSQVCKPRIDSVAPATGPAAGGTAVTVTGHCLNSGGLVVKFGGVVGANLRSVTATSAIIDAPVGSAGAVDVTIEGANGQRQTGGKLAAGFTYT